ncbi:MAG TPA: hypothetical protein VKU38_20865 [Ktedonobacteraceae bacterium]|nr:hypothetical protein [Ktedonobacteraceae bacterium]
MSQQTFTVGEMPRVVMTRVKGDVTVHAWDQREVQIETDGRVGGIQQEGDALMIMDCNSDLELMVPADASIKVSVANGDVEIIGVRRVELENASGDVEIRDIAGDAALENVGASVSLTNIGGDLSVTNTPTLRVERKVGGDVELAEVGQAELESIGGDCEVQDAMNVEIASIGGDLEAQSISTTLRCGTVGGDCEVQGSADAEVTVGNIGGDLEIESASVVQVGNIHGDCELGTVQSNVEIGNISGDLDCHTVGSNLRIGRVAGDAELSDIAGSVEISTVGGDLDLHASFPPDSHTQIKVGGDASVVLPENANLSISAMVGGDISGVGIVSTAGNVINLTYGEGAAHLNLQVGGDFELRSSDNPRSSSSMGGSWNDFGREMANFGREMGKLGQELSREISEAVKGAGWTKGASIADDIARRTEEKVRRAQQRAEEEARRAHRRAEEASRRAGRVNVRFNDREWRMDPERLDRIMDQARKATNEGISGALEAVERALGNIRMPDPPTPPVPPASPVHPVPPVQPASPVSPVSPVQEEHTGEQFEQAEQGQATSTTGSPANPEQEREAILRMIAEGRITPEEGDMLLESLGE